MSHIALAVLWLAGGSLAMAQAPSPGWFVLACAATGLAFGPLVTALSLQLGALAPRAYATEAFTWHMTVFMVGLGLGFWAGGALVEARNWTTTLHAAAGLMVLAALCCPWVPGGHEAPPP